MAFFVRLLHAAGVSFISSQRVAYITICYDGYGFGIHSDSLSGQVVMLQITEPGIIKLRDGIDIGTSKNAADTAYQHEKKMSGHYGFIFGKDHEVADWGGTWLFLELDSGDEIICIEITDGL